MIKIKNLNKQRIRPFYLVILVLMLGVIGLTSCGEPDSYKDLNHLYTKDIFNTRKTKANEYYVYIYRTGCSVCEALENDVIGYVNSNPQYKLFVINKSDKENNSSLEGKNCQDTGNANQVLGATVYTDITTCTSPCLFFVSGNEVTAVWDSKSDIANELANAKK